MRYKRDEAFRFEFGEPIPIIFKIEELDGRIVESSDGEAKMLDLSLNGMKIATLFDIPVNGHQVKVSMQFKLINNKYTIKGTLVWMEKHFDEYYYGIQFTTDEDVQEGLLDDLKVLGKAMAKKS